MKVDNSINPVTTVAVNEGKRQASTTPSTGAGQESSSSNVKISPDAAKLQSLDSTSASGSVVNTERVNEIKQAISDGNFKVNPEVVADRLLETVKELIQSKRGEG
ncbi:MAG: flagellar biosynthesis anti-sigma factor FlgM [Nitrosomonas sp.]|nr:flagellar biosynthesis anti-sigma factor FlgM [Nitrosomonas sp.]